MLGPNQHHLHIDAHNMALRQMLHQTMKVSLKTGLPVAFGL